MPFGIPWSFGPAPEPAPIELTEADIIYDASQLDVIDEFILAGEWLTVASSNVEAWHWLSADGQLNNGLLEVEFKSGAIYNYYDVPYSVARAFYETDSPGRFVWNHLRDVYGYARVIASSGPRKGPSVIRIRRDIEPNSLPIGIPYQPPTP